MTPDRTADLPMCITQDPEQPAAPDFLDVCAVNATEIACSIHCPDECDGHPICLPCLALAAMAGMLK